MATATSSRVSRKRTVIVRRATAGIEEVRTNAAVEISWINRWPAVRLAVSRTPSARGRMKRLIVSMMIRIGIRGVGVPSGRRCPRDSVGWLRIPIITVASHRGTARPKFRDSWVVGVKVYGRRPNTFNEVRKTISVVNRTAHLCPHFFKGMRSWYTKRLITQDCRVRWRLFTHRAPGDGTKSHGKTSATAMRGIPKYVGLINCSKNPKDIVSFKGLFEGLLRFELRALEGMCVQEL